MAEALSPRRLLLRPAQFPADGLLRPRADRRRRPQERRRGPRDRRVLQLCPEHVGGGGWQILRGTPRLPPDRRFSLARSGRGAVETPPVVIPGRASWHEPGIHAPDGGYGFRAL